MIDPAAQITRNPTEEEPQRERDGNADNTDGQRNAGTVDDAGEEITTEAIRAGEEHGAVLRGAQHVHVHFPDAPKIVSVGAAEKPHRLRHRAINNVVTLERFDIEGKFVRVDERSSEASVMKEV